jgi:hypothetical protein
LVEDSISNLQSPILFFNLSCECHEIFIPVNFSNLQGLIIACPAQQEIT